MGSHWRGSCGRVPGNRRWWGPHLHFVLVIDGRRLDLSTFTGDGRLAGLSGTWPLGSGGWFWLGDEFHCHPCRPRVISDVGTSPDVWEEVGSWVT